MTTSYSDEDVVATLKKLSDGCSRLYGAVTKARKVIRKQWNLRPGQEGIKDVLAASHLGSYSVFAPPWCVEHLSWRCLLVLNTFAYG